MLVALLLPCASMATIPQKELRKSHRRRAATRRSRRAVHDHRLRTPSRRTRPDPHETVGTKRPARRPVGHTTRSHTRREPPSARRRDHRPLVRHLTVAVLLDTSVLIASEQGPQEDAAISVVSLTELHFGVLIARDEETRALRTRRLGAIEDHFGA